MAQHDDDPEALSLTLTDYKWNDVGGSQITTNVPSQAVPLSNPQPHSNPELHSGLIHHWYTGYATYSSFGQAPDANLPLSAVNTECQFPAND